jgi:hypothetical protein
VLLRTVEGYQPSVRSAEGDGTEALPPVSRILH